MSGSGLGVLPCVTMYVHTESGLAGVVSLDLLLPLWLSCLEPGLDIHHPQAAYAPAVMELNIPCRMDIGFPDNPL